MPQANLITISSPSRAGLLHMMSAASVTSSNAAPEPVNCPVCFLQAFELFFELKDVPAQDGVLWNSKAEALGSPTGDIRLAFCRNCGFVGNLAFDPGKIKYDQEYSFSLHFSPTYKEFIDSLAFRLFETYQLRHKSLLEIGCGRGDFLRVLCELGHNQGLGIDPSLRSHVEQYGSYQIRFVQDFYSERFAGRHADFVCCRQVLDQLANPRGIVETLRANLGRQAKSAVYFEVPNAHSIFQGMLIRNIIYEKSAWFTPYSLARLFELSGFEVLAVAPCYEAGQYLGIEAIPASGEAQMQTGGQSELESFAPLVAAFGENYRRTIEAWKHNVSRLQQSGQRAIAWGAGSGAISFFCALKVTDQIPFAVDINPDRQGKFLPLTGQQVVPPEFIREFRPDTVVITNPTYEKEIRQQVADLGIECSFWSI